MIQEIKGKENQITQRGDVIVCNGGAKCPLRRGNTPQSAQDEMEFHRLTGIRTGSNRVRELLEEFRLRHDLTWRGRGIARLWRHRALEYDDARDCLQLNTSLWVLLYGMGGAALTAIFLAVLMALAVEPAKSVGWVDWVKWGAAMLAYGVIFYGCIEHILIPEVLARRLRRKERREAEHRLATR